MKVTWKRMGRAALLLALLAALTLSGASPLGTTAQAVTQSEIDALKGDADDLAQQRQELKAQLAQLKSDRTKVIQRRNLLDKQISVTEKEIINTENQIAGYAAMLSQTAYELEENRKEEEQKYQLFCVRTRQMEERGTASYWSALFNATDFSDLLGRLNDIQEVINYDQRVLNDLRDIRAQIQEKQEAQAALKTESEAAKLKLEGQKAELETQRSEANALVKEMEANVSDYAEALEAVAEEEERIQKAIIEKTNQLAKEMGWGTTVGGYIWPETASKRITSPMGSRNTGIKGASTNHKGVDIGGVGYNTNVLATKAGVVITSAYSSSYGNYVVISHGYGNTTLYAHMSSRSVKEGAVVTQGQVIGITGSTGVSSGPHLHYEITENSERVNPLDYLPGWIQAW